MPENTQITPSQALVNVSIICSRYDKYDLQTAEAIKASLQILGNSLMELKTLQSPADSGMLGTVASPEIPPAAAVEKAE